MISCMPARRRHRTERTRSPKKMTAEHFYLGRIIPDTEDAVKELQTVAGVSQVIAHEGNLVLPYMRRHGAPFSSRAELEEGLEEISDSSPLAKISVVARSAGFYTRRKRDWPHHRVAGIELARGTKMNGHFSHVAAAINDLEIVQTLSSPVPYEIRTVEAHHEDAAKAAITVMSGCVALQGSMVQLGPLEVCGVEKTS